MPWDPSTVRAVAPGWSLPASTRQESLQGPHPCQPSMAGWELDRVMGLQHGPVCAARSRQFDPHKEPSVTKADLFYYSNQPSANINMAIHSLTF